VGVFDGSASNNRSNGDDALWGGVSPRPCEERESEAKKD